jgi:hypothetical protein
MKMMQKKRHFSEASPSSPDLTTKTFGTEFQKKASLAVAKIGDWV